MNNHHHALHSIRVFKWCASTDGCYRLPGTNISSNIPNRMMVQNTNFIGILHVYRQLVRWCWGILGREIRVPLSSCAVCCTRAHSPLPGLKKILCLRDFILQMNNTHLIRNSLFIYSCFIYSFKNAERPDKE